MTGVHFALCWLGLHRLIRTRDRGHYTHERRVGVASVHFALYVGISIESTTGLKL
jgi:hypothetical protein